MATGHYRQQKSPNSEGHDTSSIPSTREGLSDIQIAMERVHWDGSSDATRELSSLPAGLRETLFQHLPTEIPFTDDMERLADRYVNSAIDWRHYPAFQAAAFLRPKTEKEHERRRTVFRQLRRDAETEGFSLPDVFCDLVETDSYIDRLHHNTIWLQLPEELWPLPADPSQLMFLMFSEGQGCLHWHLLLSPDGTHCVACSSYPFGRPSAWASGEVPDYSQWEVQLCADSVEEWLFRFFNEASDQDRQYLEHLNEYFQSEHAE